MAKKKNVPGKLSKTRNRMLLASVMAAILYTAANFIVLKVTGSCMDSTQTTCWFTFWGATVFTNAGITIAKTCKGTEVSSNISTEDATSGEGQEYESDEDLK